MMHAAARALLLFALGCLPVRAHDLITAEVAERYLTTLSAKQDIWRSTAPSPRRAEAAYQIGRTLDEIREFLNRDIASHKQVLGLASNRLVLELKARGTPLRTLPDGRFAANLPYYREVLDLDPEGAREADALLQLLKGYFYDSFDEDPLLPKGQSWVVLTQQIGYGERLLLRAPRHAEAEEARFILLIHHIQAALGAPDGQRRRHHAAKANAALDAFGRLHPDSLRAAAIPMLRERLEGK